MRELRLCTACTTPKKINVYTGEPRRSEMTEHAISELFYFLFRSRIGSDMDLRPQP